MLRDHRSRHHGVDHGVALVGEEMLFKSLVDGTDPLCGGLPEQSRDGESFNGALPVEHLDRVEAHPPSLHVGVRDGRGRTLPVPVSAPISPRSDPAPTNARIPSESISSE